MHNAASFQVRVLNPNHTNPIQLMFQIIPGLTLVFRCLQYKSLENTVGKGEIAHNELILLFHQFSTCFGELSVIFNKFEIVVCRLFPFGRVPNLSFGKRLTLMLQKNSF